VWKWHPLGRPEEIVGRKVFCVKFQREMPGLDEPPFEGHPIGQRIYENVSKEAWKMWIEHMKMLMNEYRLNLATQKRRNSSSSRWTIISLAPVQRCARFRPPKAK